MDLRIKGLKKIHYGRIDFPHGGFLSGKVKDHLKQTQE